MEGPSYIPGVCNIGPGEVHSKMLQGWISLACAVIFFSVARYEHIAMVLQLAVFIPLFYSILGFWQARMTFCVTFGFTGIFNVSEKGGQYEKVGEHEYLVQDRKRATGIVFLVFLISTALTGVLVYV